jgi:hypothetical protein
MRTVHGSLKCEVFNDCNNPVKNEDGCDRFRHSQSDCQVFWSEVHKTIDYFIDKDEDETIWCGHFDECKNELLKGCRDSCFHTYDIAHRMLFDKKESCFKFDNDYED